MTPDTHTHTHTHTHTRTHIIKDTVSWPFLQQTPERNQIGGHLAFMHSKNIRTHA